MLYYRIHGQKRSYLTKVTRKPSVIEINGNRYDAITGQLLAAVKKTSSHLAHPIRGPVIDGFRRKLPTSKAQTVHSRTQRSKTLMRSVVAKPVQAKDQSSKLKPPKARTSAVAMTRLSRAMNLAKDSHVKRFGHPVGRSKLTPSHAASRSKPTLSDDIISPRPASGSAAMAIRPLPSMITSVSHHRLERMLDEALIRADAHKQAMKGRLSGQRRLSWRFRFIPRWLIITLMILILASVGAYAAWRYIPEVSIKFASIRAQIKGSVPDYVPSGFKFAGPIKYQSGAISLMYKSSIDGSYFTITQQASNWDSSSLEANTIADGSQVQTSQVKGTTVYIYDANKQATWVNHGIRYVIMDEAQLNSDELLKIADSL